MRIDDDESIQFGATFGWEFKNGLSFVRGSQSEATWWWLSSPTTNLLSVLAEDKTYLINLFFVYYETTASRSPKWTRESSKRWNKNTKTIRRSERVKQKQKKNWETRRNVKMKMHCIETDEAVKIMRKIATATALATAAFIAKWLCCSIQIENMKTIWKVLEIFSSFVCSFHRVVSAWTVRHAVRRRRRHFSSHFTAMHAVCYHGFNLFIFEYFAWCPTNARYGYLRKHTRSHRVRLLAEGEKEVCTFLTLLTFTPRGRWACGRWRRCHWHCRVVSLIRMVRARGHTVPCDAERRAF